VGCRLGQRPLGTDRHISSAVAGRALSRRAVMIHHGRSEGDEIGVTRVADVYRGDMVGRLGQAGTAALVTIGAGMVADNHRRRGQCVVECGCCPTRGRLMATIALLGRGDVRDRLGLGILAQVGAVMAGQALAGKTGVIHGAHQEAGRAGVAGVALGGRWDMGGGFAHGRPAVMAGRALAYHGRVVREAGRLPEDCRMAGVAGCRGWNVGRRLAGRVHAVVTGGTSTGGDTAMIEGGCRPSQRVVASVARRSCHYVRGWLARRIYGIVAGKTGAFVYPLMPEDDDVPRGCPMAGITAFCRRNMSCGQLRRCHATGIPMAGGTIAGGAPEYPLRVTGLATGLDVLSR